MQRWRTMEDKSQASSICLTWWRSSQREETRYSSRWEKGKRTLRRAAMSGKKEEKEKTFSSIPSFVPLPSFLFIWLPWANDFIFSRLFVSISISIPQRAQYEETILDLKKKVEEETGVPVDKQLLFWHFKELTQEYDNKTLLDLNLHTGFSLTGYDLVRTVHAYKRACTSISFFFFLL